MQRDHPQRLGTLNSADSDELVGKALEEDEKAEVYVSAVDFPSGADCVQHGVQQCEEFDAGLSC